MNKNEIQFFYHRDIQRVIDEIALFKDEANIWKVAGAVKNSAGNLALHLSGGLNYLIGSNLSNTGYVRNRDAEFTTKGIDREQLIKQLEKLSSMIDKTLSSLTNEELEGSFPVFFDKENATIGYVLIQLLLHLNYHLGQINYLRRILE
jgi:hypothetical protein